VNLLNVILSTVLVSVCAGVAQIEDKKPQLWKGLSPGSFAVGFKIANVYDDSRTIIGVDEKNQNSLPRPVQISMWYPAEIKENSEFMSFSEYVLNEGTEFDFAPLNKKRKEEILDSFRDQVVRWGGKASNVDMLLRKATSVVKDADPATGKFPLILYAPGGDAPSDGNTVLCEYLASHGYVVAACPSNGMYSEEMTLDLKGIETQVRDLEFVYANMKDITSVDLPQVGTVGFSFGGLANVMLANRNLNIRAVVSLDGGITYPAYAQLMDETPFKFTRELSVPFLLGMSQPNDQQTTDFFDSLQYCDTYLVQFGLANHFGFSSRYLFLNQAIDEEESREQVAQMVDGYSLMCRYVLHFLDGYLKGDKKGIDFIRQSPDDHGFSNLKITYQSKKTKSVPPTEEYFFAVLQSEGIKEASDFFKKTRITFPEIKLFSEERINTTCIRLMNDVKIDEAMTLYEIYFQAYPESVNALLGLGNIYLQKENIKKAKIYFQKVTELDPENSYATEILKKIASGG